MKKAFLIAFAALFAFAAQAVTTSWTSHGTVTQGQTITLDGTSTTTTGFSAAIIFNLSSTAMAENLGGIFNVMSDTLCAGMGPGKSYGSVYPWATLNVNGEATSGTNKAWNRKMTEAGFKTGENVIGVTIEKTTHNSTPVTMISWYINGTLVAGTTAGSFYSNNYFDAIYDEVIIGSSSEMSDIKLYTATGVATAEDFASVPEPTALALLALGVAGLALKRKVA